ncbi:MAG TPA: crosslink repair DNA glycosylase YcaQ family protein [Vicinamibacteria bacterium]|nr:crosslink repair DNA glycosylase YcaQ family protein [Vicinamibacteria bacterium]
MAYKDRGPVVGNSGRDVFAHYFLLEGKLAGSWRRTATKDTVDVEAVPHGRLNGDARRALAAAADRYGRFLGLRGRLAIGKK